MNRASTNVCTSVEKQPQDGWVLIDKNHGVMEWGTAIAVPRFDVCAVIQ